MLNAQRNSNQVSNDDIEVSTLTNGGGELGWWWGNRQWRIQDLTIGCVGGGGGGEEQIIESISYFLACVGYISVKTKKDCEQSELTKIVEIEHLGHK